MVSSGGRWLRRLMLVLGFLVLGAGGGLVWAGGGLAGPAVLDLPVPAGFQHAVLRLASPGVGGYWVVRWLQPTEAEQGVSALRDAAAWQRQLHQHFGLQALASGLWWIPATASSSAVLLQRQGAAWLLSQWQPAASEPVAWQHLRALEVAVGGAQLLSDWLTDTGQSASRQQIWRQTDRKVAQWQADLIWRWQQEGWRSYRHGSSADTLNMQVWQRGSLERLAVWLPQESGAVLLLTHQVMAGGRQ